MSKNLLILGSLLVCFNQINCVLNPKVLCYYENWFVWRNGDGKMTVDDVDSSLCTHIVYAYMGVTASSEIFIQDPWLMVEKHDLTKFSANKGHAKALIAIGGYSLSTNFATMVSDSTSRSTFITSVTSFLSKYGYDGISLDWSRSSWNENEFEDFVKLLKELHNSFAGKYTLGITVAARPINFKAEKVDKLVDFITVQTYDLHGSWEHEVNHQAPLDWQISTLREWEDAGATAHNLLMTLPLFGHTWKLVDPSATKPGSKASGPGRSGPWSQAEGKLSYNEICKQIINSRLTPMADAKEDGAAYVVDDGTWITFESPATAKSKAHNATTEGYGGIVVQALANEDFKGLCGSKYPLLHAINDGLNREDTKDRTHAPHVTTTRPIVTADPHKLCHAVGVVIDPKDCHVYHKCTEFFPGIFTDERHECPKGEGFDISDHTCKDEKSVSACH